MFEIIQLLRSAKAPMRAQDIAESLEISRRTVYRDIASLQAMRTPIEGAAGLGYVLRNGYDLPPINFTSQEAEALSVGLSMIARTGDPDLLRAAKSAARKLSDIAPPSDTLIASSWGTPVNDAVDMGLLRQAILSETKLTLSYCDIKGATTRRIIQPLLLIYYSDTTLLVAMCELRADFRHFRLDRIQSADLSEDRFSGQGQGLRDQWTAALKDQTVDTL